MPGIHKVELVGQEVVADHLGVGTSAISNWYARNLHGMPVAIEVQFCPGKKPVRVWRRAQLAVWEKWYERHQANRGKQAAKGREEGVDNGPRRSYRRRAA